MARKPFTFMSNIDKVIEKIEEKPEKVLRVIAQNLTREVRANLRKYYQKRTGTMDKSLSYSLNRRMYQQSNFGQWPPSRTPFLMIGFKAFYAPMVLRNNDPIKPVVIKNKDLIQEMIAKAIDEINKE